MNQLSNQEKLHINLRYEELRYNLMTYLPNYLSVNAQAIILTEQLKHLNEIIDNNELIRRWNRFRPEIRYWNDIMLMNKDRDEIIYFLKEVLKFLEYNEYYEICKNYHFFIENCEIVKVEYDRLNDFINKKI